MSPLARSTTARPQRASLSRRRERLVERQAGEGAVLARQRQADDGMIAGEGEAPGIAGAKGDRLEAARRRIDMAELPGARIEQPEAAVRGAGANGAWRDRRRRSRRVATSMTTPPSARRSRQPSAASDRETAVA